MFGLNKEAKKEIADLRDELREMSLEISKLKSEIKNLKNEGNVMRNASSEVAKKMIERLRKIEKNASLSWVKKTDESYDVKMKVENNKPNPLSKRKSYLNGKSHGIASPPNNPYLNTYTTYDNNSKYDSSCDSSYSDNSSYFSGESSSSSCDSSSSSSDW